MICPAIISNSSLPDALLSDYGNTCRLLHLSFGEIHARRSGLIAKADRQLKQKASVTNTLSVLNKSTLKEASDMKGLLHSMTAASIAAGVALLSSNPVVASDRQTPDSGQNTTGNEPSVALRRLRMRQEAAQRPK